MISQKAYKNKMAKYELALNRVEANRHGIMLSMRKLMGERKHTIDVESNQLRIKKIKRGKENKAKEENERRPEMIKNETEWRKLPPKVKMERAFRIERRIMSPESTLSALESGLNNFVRAWLELLENEEFVRNWGTENLLLDHLVDFGILLEKENYWIIVDRELFRKYKKVKNNEN